MKIDNSKICIRNIGYSEQPVLSVTEGMYGSLRSRTGASVEVYTSNDWKSCWEDLRNFICDRVGEELDSIK